MIHGAGVSPAAAHIEPRATYNWLLRNRRGGNAPSPSGKSTPTTKKRELVSVDWNFPLGTGTVPASMYPAKYSFDAGSAVLTAANCTSDYLVYGLNTAGSGTQPNLVRFNNIYAGGAGLCGLVSLAASPNGARRLTNVVTITTTAAHSFTVGMQVSIAGVTDTSFNGTFTVTSVPTTTTFTYAQTAANANSGGGSASFGTANALTAYDVTTQAGGAVLTSPVISMDGTKLAFIESAPAAAIFHVLTWGTSGNNGSWSNATRTYTAVAPGGVNNNAVLTSLSYSASSNTFSSPWVDYRPGPSGDHAYFGDDNGKLYRTTCVFYCSTAPALDTGWPITVAVAGVKLSPPVHDAVSNRIFVGGSDGNLYLVDLAQCPGVNCTIAGGGLKSVAVGSALNFGGVVDGPLVDASFQTVFAFAGNNGSGAGVVLQTDTSFAMAPIRFTMGSSAVFNIYAGALDDAYYQNVVGGATVGGNLFACGQLGGSGQPDLYWIPFTKNAGNLSTVNPPRLNTAGSNPKNVNIPGNPGIGCTPLTAFKNGATDRLFFSQSSLPANKCVSGSPADGCMMMYNITTPNSTIGNSPNAAAVENLGTSAIIVDNASASGQASSVYFSNQGTATCTTGVGPTTPAYCAVKLTQSALQ